MATDTDLSPWLMGLLELLPWLVLFAFGVRNSILHFDYEQTVRMPFQQPSKDPEPVTHHDIIDAEVNYGPKKGHLQLIHGGKSKAISQPDEQEEKIAG